MLDRTRFAPIASIAIAVVVGVSACGSSETSMTPAPTAASSPSSTIDRTGGPSHSDDPDIALIRLDDSLARSPDLVIGGDRWVYFSTRDRPELAGFARLGPLPPVPRPFLRRQLTEAGLDKVLDEAERLGLLAAPPEYTSPEIYDVTSTRVTFEVDAGTFDHSAYALGFEDDDDRARLSSFVKQLRDLERFVGADNLGPSERWVPDRYVVEAPIWSDVAETSDPERMWPADVPVEYGCIELPIDRFPDGVAGLYVAEDNQYAEVAPDLPGDICN